MNNFLKFAALAIICIFILIIGALIGLEVTLKIFENI